jgi:hypothetical protein
MRGRGADLPTRRGKSIGGDRDVDDEGSEQNFESLQSLDHCSVEVRVIKLTIWGLTNHNDGETFSSRLI